jgi:hypothetical protein
MAAPRRRSESGFAMLLVFLMAAVIAISLYMEVPRVAFESQRQKEQMLVDRGEQYKRAIKVFFNTNKRWPAKIEDLENTNGRRYLRKRYIDPMTGKDEWRAVHIANGVLTDSKVQKAPGTDSSKSSTAGQYVQEMAGIGQAPAGTGTGGAAVATRRRASDGMMPGVPGGAPAAAGDPNNPNNDVAAGQPPGMPGAQPPQGMPPGMVPGVPGMPGMPGATGRPGQLAPGVAMPGQVPVAGNMPGVQPAQQQQQGSGYITGGAYIGSQPAPQPGQTGQYPGQAVNSQYQGASPYNPNPGQLQNAPGAFPGQQQPGANIGQQSDAARQMLQQALYGPRPGGPPQVVAGGVVGGTGIAGFASTADAEGIMVYNDRTNYGEWEFVFDPVKDNKLFNPIAGGNGTPAAQVGTPASQLGSQPGTPASQMGSQPGSAPAQPAQSPFGPGPIR